MSKVLFIEKKLRTDKLGMLYLSRVMKDAGHTVDMIQDDTDSADTYLECNHVDFVMYSVSTTESRWFIEKNKLLKKRHNFIAVVGGPHFTFFPEEGLSDADINFVVQGPGEGVVLDILAGRIQDKFVKGNLPDDINTIPAPDRSILYKYDEFGKSRMKRFIASRDCRCSCSYCFNHLLHRIYKDEKKKFFQRTAADKMIDEIKETREKYGLEIVYFNDDDLAQDHDWLLGFCDNYKRKIGLPFCGSVRADSLDRKILEIMRHTGCFFLNIALESANPETQKLLRRGGITNQQIKDACLICKELGIKVRLQNMIGLPVRDPLKDALETLDYNQEINPFDSWVSIFQPFPKTDLWNYCIEKNFIKTDAECKDFYEGTCLNFPDKERILRLQKWWYFIVKYKIPMELVYILLDLPLTPEDRSKIQKLRWQIAAESLYGL